MCDESDDREICRPRTIADRIRRVIARASEFMGVRRQPRRASVAWQCSAQRDGRRR